MPVTAKAAELAKIVPADGDEPSPQSMLAVKSAGVALGLSSEKVATASLKAVPSVAEKSTGEAVMTVAPALAGENRAMTPHSASAAASRLVFDSSQPLRMSSPLRSRAPPHVERGSRRLGSSLPRVRGFVGRGEIYQT